MSNYRCCETCGNEKCKENTVAIYYDACIASKYKEHWMPKYVWIGMEYEPDDAIDDNCRLMDLLLKEKK